MSTRTLPRDGGAVDDDCRGSDHPRPFLVGMGAYAALVVIGSVAVRQADDPPLALAVVFALLPAAAATYAIVGQFRSVRAQEGVERLAYTDAAAMAFFVTVLSALAWSFVESFADAPRLPAVVTWLYGIGVWGLLYLVLHRRYR